MRGKEGAVDRCKWVSLDKAASHLGLNAAALRKTLERRALRSADGATEVALDGVDAGAIAREGSRS